MCLAKVISRKKKNHIKSYAPVAIQKVTLHILTNKQILKNPQNSHLFPTKTA